jgi:hypothetical protein
MLFKVEGSKKAIIESTNKAIVYYNAPSESDVRKHLLKQPIDNGGFTSFTVEEIASLPPESGITCPHCQKQITDERNIVNVGMGIGAGTSSDGKA